MRINSDSSSMYLGASDLFFHRPARGNLRSERVPHPKSPFIAPSKMKKTKISPKTGMKPKPFELAISKTILVIETSLSTITSKPMNAEDADAIKTMLVEKLGTLNCMLVATAAGDVIIGGEALRQSLVRFQAVTGNEGAMATLLAQVNDILSNSTHADAKDFDSKTWLEAWVLLPRLSLSGAAPIDLIRTDAGLKTVQRTLAAMETGVFL